METYVGQVRKKEEKMYGTLQTLHDNAGEVRLRRYPVCAVRTRHITTESLRTNTLAVWLFVGNELLKGNKSAIGKFSRLT
ncbi:hypothetical protein PGB90_010225 [Kerria lacca]